ncbi:PR domain zinc finger protein 4 [Orchesella cincta]|uniref:PR domain zinc finger protein 4 n=1 Tax=Orchesella cincta TaxID=48709 RepID=A0A1D2MKC5_ORCCI|nr:PR domain zinc finger protein 4 [Orchesella cincta]
MAPNKEDFLERKILCLEKRLTLIERFVEARFSESLQDYANVTYTPHYHYPPPPSPLQYQPSFSRPAPASVKRKALERIVVDTPRFSPKISSVHSKAVDLDGVRDCVVKVIRLQLPGEENAEISQSSKSQSVPSTSTTVKEIGGVASRTRRIRNPVVREDFITESRPRRRKVGGGDSIDSLATPATQDAVDEDADDQDDMAVNSGSPLPSPQVADMVDTCFEDDDPPESHEEEVDETYFIFPGTLRPAKTTKRELRASRGATNNDGGDDDNEGEDQLGYNNDLLDKDWSGAEDDAADDDPADDQNIKQPTKRKHAPPRPRLPDGTRPKRVYLSSTIDSIRIDAICVTDRTFKECHICHKHFKDDAIDSHMETHTKARHLLCNFANCDKSFYTHVSLMKHRATHEPEKFGRRCRFCSKLFARKDKALYHERNCVKRAAERGEVIDPTIVEDMRRRSKGRWNWTPPTSIKDAQEEKKRCPHCHLSVKLSRFEKHLKVHDEDGKNWKCNLCEKSYFNKRNLVRHIASMHPDKQPSTTSTRQEGESDDGISVKNEVLEGEDEITDEPQDNQETPQGQVENDMPTT